MSHLKQHSFTGNSDHDFTGLAQNQLLKLNNAGTAIESFGTGTTSSFSSLTNVGVNSNYSAKPIDKVTVLDLNGTNSSG